MSIKDEFSKFINAGQEGSDSVTKDIPEAWRPRSEIGTDGGFVISTPRPDGTTPGAEEILREANLNPEEWAVISHRRSRWQRYDGEWLESFRVNVAVAISTEVVGSSVENPNKDLIWLILLLSSFGIN